MHKFSTLIDDGMRRLWTGMAAAALLLSLPGTSLAAPPLVDAVKGENRDVVLSLLDQGAEVDLPESDGTTALMWAVYLEQEALVAALLAAGADPNHENEYGSSPIMEATLKGNNPILKRLLEAGADHNWANAEGETALMIAARNGNLDAAELLLNAGATINATETWGGQSALMWATAQKQIPMMKLLIRHGADVNARSTARLWDRRITSEPRPKDMNKGGFTSLHFAARQSCVECAEILLNAGANINATDPDRVSALSLALLNLNFDVAAHLIEAGAEVNTWDLFGRTPLYHAVDMNTMPDTGRSDIPAEDKHNALDIVNMLLARGANPNAQLKLRPPYRNAVLDRRSDHILGYGATPLMRAAKASDNEVIRLLLNAGAIVDLPNWMGLTPLMVAAGLGRTDTPTRGLWQTEEQSVETLKILLEAGADINVQASSYKGRWAHMEDERDFFRDIPEDGQTALHGAARLGWNQVIEFLVENGARLQIPDHLGRTALDIAWGRYPAPFLLADPVPLPKTIALLEELCKASDNCQLPEDSSVTPAD